MPAARNKTSEASLPALACRHLQSSIVVGTMVSWDYSLIHALGPIAHARMGYRVDKASRPAGWTSHGRSSLCHEGAVGVV